MAQNEWAVVSETPIARTEGTGWEVVEQKPTTGAFAAGVKSYLPQVQETFGGLKTLLGVGAERMLGEGQISRGLIESGAASMKEAEAKRQPFMTAERASFTDALDKGVGAVLTEWLPYQAGSGAMQLLESLGLMGAGALAGSALPGPGTIAGAGTGLVARELAKQGVKEAAEKILKERGEDAAKAYFENEAKKAAAKIGGTAALASQAAFYGTGQTTSRAVEEAQKLGGTATDIELARVLPAAAVSTVAEFIGDKIALGALKGIKPGEAGKYAPVDLAKNILLNIGLTGTKEVPVEVIQSVAERYGAKLSLTDAQALKEYIDATAASYGMAVAPGVGGGVRQTMAERARPAAPEVQPAAPAVAPPPAAPVTEIPAEPGAPVAPLAPPVAEAPPVQPAAETPVAPPLAPAPEAPPAAPTPPVKPVVEAAAPAPTAPAAPAAPKFEPQIVSRQPAPDGMEVHVFTTTDGYGTGLFDADAKQYVNGSITRFAGEDTLPKAKARAAEMLKKATPVEAATEKKPSERQEQIAFGKAIGAAQPYPGSLTGRVNLPAQKAAKEGNFQGVLSALEKSKNVIVAEIAKRAKSLGTKIVIDANAEETYTGPSELMRQMSIDGAKMHLEALEKIRALAPKIDALPDGFRLGYDITGEKINAIDQGKDAGRMSLEEIADMGHSMFAPLATGPFKLKTKEDFKRLQKAYEDLTSEYGENALQLTSTGSAEMRGVAGAYDADTDTIRVPEYFAKREEVLSHEIVHAQTVQAIANPTLRQKPIVARLNKLYEHVKKELEGMPGRAPYGIQSIQEFVAEGMGNPWFQFRLKKIKYENTSAWDSFVQTIANLIGVKRDTAFTELLSIYSDLTTEQKAAAPTVEAAAPKAEAPPTLDTSGVTPAKGRHPQVQAAAKLLQEKKMSREEFEKYVDAYKPIETIKAETLYPPSSVESMAKAIRGAKNKRKINIPIADGTRVGLRMDLPARDQGVPVVSIHEGKPNDDPKTGKPYKSSGKVIGYGSTGYIKDVFFAPRDQEKSLVMGIEPIKEPLQTAEGTWFNLSPEETYARVKELMKDPAWKQVGFDPARHGYFYDRKTREPVVSASEMYQVGQFLLAKDVEYAPKENYLYSVEPTVKSDRLPSYKRGVENLRKRWEKGEITAEEFANRVDMLARQIESVELAKEFKGRERGADFIRQRLLEAKRRGELSDEAVDFAEWFILRNPALVDDLGISIRTPKEEGVGGMYSEMARVMYLMKERGNDQTIVHEILHHLERMMPKDVQTAIRKNWIKSLMEAQKNAKSEAEKTFFANLVDYHFANGPRSKLDAAIEAIKNGDVEPSFYQYTSPSEFWAVNGSEIMQGRFDAKGALLQRLKRWLSELKEKARDLFGLNSTAPIIRALDSLSKGDGKFVSKTLLDDVRETRQVIEREGAGKEAGESKNLRDRATANFKRWFGDSKVVDEKGEPLVVYHGGPSGITAFDASRQDVTASYGPGFYFTTSADRAKSMYALGPKSEVYPVYLSIKNPATLDQARKLKFDRKAMEAAGFDGIAIEREGDTEYVAFKPTQIKSATQNNGDYSLTNADIRKSIGGRNPGEQAISIVNSLGMGVKPPEPGRFEKAKKFLKDAGENPSLTKESAKKTLTKWLDWFETTVFSSDSAFNNKIRRGIISDFKQNPEVLGMLLEASQSQTVHADALASQFMIDGGLQYNEELKKWESVKKDDNFVALAKKIEDLAKKYNVTKDEMERIAHTYFVAKRLPGIIKRNEELDAEIKAERATAKPDRKQIEEWESLKVFVSDEQLAMMEPGLSLVKTIPELEQVVDIWQGIRKNNIEVMVNSGLWSPEYATAMWDNMDYVPYYREEQLEEGAGPQEFIRGLQVKSKEFQLKGSGAAVNDVFDNMIRWSQYAMNRAIRAHKATQMIDAALKIEVDGKPMATKVTEQKRGMNIVRVFRDGKQELYDMADPLFVNAFASIPNVSIPIVTLMSKVSNVLRQSVVLYPLFSVAQVPQDSFAAMFSSGLKTQHALKIPYLAVKEFIKTLSKTSATHNELTKYGVVGVRDFSATVIRDDAEIYAGLKPPKGGWGKTKEFLEHIAMAADNSVRQAVYEASMQQGLNKSEALEKAFEIINFRRRGTSKALNVMGQTIPFFYAYLSAQRVAYRVLSGVGISPTERKEALTTLATTSAAVAALSMLYAMAVGDDEDYAETPAAIRDRTLTIPGSGGVRIPLRPDFFLFPKIIAEHTYLMLSDKGFEDGAKFRKSMADALLSAVASPTPFPTAIKPAIEVAINYDFFQGKPLIGNFEKQKDVERQFRDSTSELAKLFGQTGLISPIAADHMIRGMLGSFGGLLLFGTNQFLHSDPDVPRPELSAKEMLAALPGTSGLLKRPQESALKNDFYVLRDEVEKAANTFNDIKNRSPEGIQAFLEDEKNMARLGLAKGVDKINRELSKIRKVMTQITNMPESQMSADEKSENIRQLRELEREILRSVNVKEMREMAQI